MNSRVSLDYHMHGRIADTTRLGAVHKVKPGKIGEYKALM